MKLMTPDMLTQAIRTNPTILVETLQRFDTFKLVGNALTPEMQVTLSSNGKLINEYLTSEVGQEATRYWASEFSKFVDSKTNAELEKIREKEKALLRLQIEAQVRSEKEADIRREVEESLRAEIKQEILEKAKPAIIPPRVIEVPKK